MPTRRWSTCARPWRLVDESRSWRLADAAAPYRAHRVLPRKGGAVDLRLRPQAARALGDAIRCIASAMAFTESSAARFMQPRTFRGPYSTATASVLMPTSSTRTTMSPTRTVVRRDTESAMGPVSFPIFSFLNRISSRAPDFFKIPHDAIHRGGVSGGDIAHDSDTLPFLRPGRACPGHPVLLAAHRQERGCPGRARA